jgi:predicted chitinase
MAHRLQNPGAMNHRALLTSAWLVGSLLACSGSDPAIPGGDPQPTQGQGGTSSAGGKSGSSSSGNSGNSNTKGSSGMAGSSSQAGASGIGSSAGTGGNSGTNGTNGTSGSGGDGGSSGTSGSGSTGGTSGTSGSGGTSGSSGTSGSGGTNGVCVDWVYMGDNPSACEGHLGSSCGWTQNNEGQGYHCQTVSWGTGCEPGGGGCGGMGSGGSTGAQGGSGGTSGTSGGTGGTGGTSGGTGLAQILSQETFNAMFPNNHLPIYSYQGLLDAAAAYPGFADSGSIDARKREIAAFLANVARESGELQYVDEINKADYCDPSPNCPCEPGQQYFGRGAIQLSWNYNYCAAGSALGYDLRANPGQVSSNPKLVWLTGMWYWMTATGAGSQTCHNGIANSGFGSTIQTINGGLECNGKNPGAVQVRVDHYLNFCSILGVSPGGNLTC